MGTNFYLQRKVTEEGRRQDLHICKLSAGWSPSMQGYHGWGNDPTIKTWFDWKMFLRNETQNNEGLIFDEYDELVSYDIFVKKIEEWQKAAQENNFDNHAKLALEGEFGEFSNSPKDYWIDPQGYSFTSRDFS